MRRYILAMAALAALAASPAARADILYSYDTTLAAKFGPDTSLLDGAAVHISFEVPAGSLYVDRFGFPAVPVVDPLITISGSGVPINNGMFALEPTAFYPAFAGFFSEPGGRFISFLLPGGVSLTITGNTIPTASGSAAMVGGTPVAAEFGPTTSFENSYSADDATEYALLGSVISPISDLLPLPGGPTASQQVAAVPEPASLTLLGLGALGLIGYARRRKA